jgi:ribosome-associated protein
VLVDLGEIIVHVMQPAVRAYYNLEQLWGGTPPFPHPTNWRNAPGVEPSRAL